ncbi:hypothetical protein BDN72DRAFT_864879 [Pluteus cervinus]|uniref:Uncharacterized protein n=1 Tax=Pluteus cervinus TaxID=181527 RepID=A0ACD3A4K8_9AGAR|nr:hypothetical protein BDN72DRAFT_864879 [Pluteus cervinus]
MDIAYNVNAATLALDEAQRYVEEEREYLHSIVKTVAWETSYGLSFTDNPTSWRLVNRTHAGEEVVFTLQGVVEAKTLPPILDNSKVPRNKAQFLHQSITLNGLGTPTFNESLDALRAMYPMFCRQFPEGRLTATFMSGTNLTFSNRFFTKRSEAGQLGSVPFERSVDPKNVLAQMLNSTLIHTEENQVKYYIRQHDMGNIFKYLPAEPQTFRVGDIVEVQFSLVVYQMRAEHYTCKPMLYSVALLNAKYGNDLAMQHSPMAVAPGSAKPLKRKVGYPTHKGDIGGSAEAIKRPRVEGDEDEVGGLQKMSLEE